MGTLRTVLVVIRTRTSLAWLIEILPALFADRRIQVVFTVNESRPSAFGDGVGELVTQIGGVLIPWEQAQSLRFELILTAHESGELERLRGPLLVLPHGPGYSKNLDADGSARSALAFAAVRADRTVAAVPSAATVPFVHPTAETVIVGDPCFDSIAAARSVHERHRNALSIPDDSMLVTVLSTWGRFSLFSSWPELPCRLLEEMPSGRYRVALALHPNIWTAHGEWQIRLWLRRELASGLMLLPWDQGWRQAVAASDLVIADHSGTGLYAAASGVPFMLGVRDTTELSPGTTVAELVQHAPALDRGRDLRPQVENALIADGALATRLANAFSHRGEALSRLRSVAYEMLELAPLHEAEAAPLPTVAVARESPRSWVVTQTGSPAKPVQLETFPAAAALDAHSDTSHFVVSFDDESDRRRLDAAAVVLTSTTTRMSESPALLEALRTQHPDASLVGVRVYDGLLLTDRRRRAWLITSAASPGPVALAALMMLGLLRTDRETMLPDRLAAWIDGTPVEAVLTGFKQV